MLKSWCTGEDSNLRSSKERQIYSLLPLTARPPVHRKTSAGTKRKTATPINAARVSRHGSALRTKTLKTNHDRKMRPSVECSPLKSLLNRKSCPAEPAQY